MNLCYSVIIPFHGSMAILEKVLYSLGSTQYPKKEIIVVNDGTNYDFGAIVKKYQCELINLPQKRGPSFARNAGAKAANFEYLVFLDSDIVVPENCFAEINDFLKNNQSVSVANCWISSYSPYSNFFSQYINVMFRYNILKKGGNTVFSSFCVIAARPFWEVEGFDENVPLPYADDIVLGWKLYDKGCKFKLVDRIEATHYRRMTLLKLILGRFLHGYFYGKFYSIYRRKPNSFKSCLRTEGVIFPIMILIASILIYYRALSLPIGLLIVLGIFLGTHFNFLNFLLKEEGYLFTFKSIWIIIFQYIIYSIGGIVGIISGFFTKGKVVKNLKI